MQTSAGNDDDLFSAGGLVMRNLRLFCLLMIMVWMPLPLTHGQHTLTTLHLIERVIKEEEPSCELTQVSVRKNQAENYAYLIWKCGEQEVRVDINEYSSVTDTQIRPNSLMTADSRRAAPLKNLGDEAFLLDEGSYSKGTFNVIFRKGKVRMDVTAASADLAQRFARLFADALPAAQQGVAPNPPKRVLKDSFYCSAR